MSEKNKTMIVKNVSAHEQKMFNPIPYRFPPGESVEVTYSIGQDLIKQHEFVEVKGKKERTPDPNEAVDKKKRKVK